MVEDSGTIGRIMSIGKPATAIDEGDLAGMVRDHRRLSRVCDQLEKCADALPANFADTQCIALCDRLREIVVSRRGGASDQFGRLFARSIGQPLHACLIAHIEACSIRDADYAGDMTAALSSVSRPCAEALGYMLRGVFEGCRSTIDFTILAILTLGNGRLTAGARTLLVTELARGGAC